MAKKSKKAELRAKPAKKSKKAKPKDYTSPAARLRWIDQRKAERAELYEELAELRQQVTLNAERLKNAKAEVKGLELRIEKHNAETDKYDGHQPPGRQGKLTDLKPEPADGETKLPTAETKAEKPATEPAGETKPWFPDDLWKKFPLARWAKYGLSEKTIEKMAEGEIKNATARTPLIVYGDIAGFIQPFANNPSFTRSFADIVGIGAGAANKISDAEEAFLADWRKGLDKAFALEQGYTPDKTVEGKPADDTAGKEDSQPSPKRRGRKPKGVPAGGETEPVSKQTGMDEPDGDRGSGRDAGGE